MNYTSYIIIFSEFLPSQKLEFIILGLPTIEEGEIRSSPASIFDFYEFKSAMWATVSGLKHLCSIIVKNKPLSTSLLAAK